MAENPDLEEQPELLEQEVQKYGSSRAVLHKLDQIAGGSGTDLDETQLGDARVDYSIGAQWRGKRVNGLDKKTRDFANKHKDNIENIKMNVTLNYVIENK